VAKTQPKDAIQKKKLLTIALLPGSPKLASLATWQMSIAPQNTRQISAILLEAYDGNSIYDWAGSNI